MNRIANAIGANLFYEALRGEFMPPTDQMQRQHTLAHLAMSTLEKGRNVSPHSPRHVAPEEISLQLTPSWADESAAIVNLNRVGALTSLELVTLGPTGHLLGAHDPFARFSWYIDGKTPVMEINTHEGNVLISGITSGLGVTVLQEVATETALGFYNQLVS